MKNIWVLLGCLSLAFMFIITEISSIRLSVGFLDGALLTLITVLGVNAGMAFGYSAGIKRREAKNKIVQPLG